jgi:hypothetical protein
MKGTREQLIRDIFTWFDDTDPSSEHVFWLSGLAGTGKSSVARTIATLADEQRRLAATFFFSRNLVATRAPSAIIPTIVHQLALCLPSVRPLICAALTSDPHVRDRDVAAQAKALLENVSWTAISGGPFLVVLDALDECHVEDGRPGGDAVPKLLETFKSLGCIKFLITSRGKGPIQRMFNALQSKVALHDINRIVVQSDIYHYLERSFSQLAHDRDLALPFPPAIKLEKLVRRAGLLFVYAATVAKWIADPEAEPSLRLDQILDKDEDEVPYQHKLLDDMYLDILSEAAKTSGNPQKHECALKNVISTVVLIQEPVAASALAILAGEEKKTAGLLPLFSAVLLVGESAPVRLFHPSFPEFIVSEERCRDKRFLVVASEGHLHLAIRCLDVMNTYLLENIRNIKDHWLPNMIESSPSFSEQRSLVQLINVYPPASWWLPDTEVYHLKHSLGRVAPVELRYACKYWHVHLRLADLTSVSLINSLETFCTAYLLHWLELLRVFNELSTAQTGLPLLLDHLRVRAQLPGLIPTFIISHTSAGVPRTLLNISY